MSPGGWRAPSGRMKSGFLIPFSMEKEWSQQCFQAQDRMGFSPFPFCQGQTSVYNSCQFYIREILMKFLAVVPGLLLVLFSQQETWALSPAWPIAPALLAVVHLGSFLTEAVEEGSPNCINSQSNPWDEAILNAQINKTAPVMRLLLMKGSGGTSDLFFQKYKSLRYQTQTTRLFHFFLAVLQFDNYNSTYLYSLCNFNCKRYYACPPWIQRALLLFHIFSQFLQK